MCQRMTGNFTFLEHYEFEFGAQVHCPLTADRNAPSEMMCARPAQPNLAVRS